MIRTLNRIYYVTTGVFVSLLAVFAVLLFFGQRELTQATSLRYVSYLLATHLPGAGRSMRAGGRPARPADRHPGRSRLGQQKALPPVPP
jgi:hypothetical protein